jgi:hypothetical protein
MLKKWVVFAAVVISAFSSQRIFGQEFIQDLVGKPFNSPEVQRFVLPLALDATTGISYENGVQAFHDGNTLFALYFFNTGSLNGQAVKAYRQQLPYGLTFRETTETLKKKLGSSPAPKGDHWLWKLGTVEVEIAFSDTKKTEISFLALSVAE